MADQMDLFGGGSDEGWRLALEGMERARSHADRVSFQDGDFRKIWSNCARDIFHKYLKENRGKEFTAEDIRDLADAVDFIKPPDGRAWGSIFRSASSAGLITAQYYTKAKRKASHCKPLMVWKSFVGESEIIQWKERQFKKPSNN